MSKRTGLCIWKWPHVVSILTHFWAYFWVLGYIFKEQSPRLSNLLQQSELMFKTHYRMAIKSRNPLKALESCFLFSFTLLLIRVTGHFQDMSNTSDLDTAGS